MAKISPTEAREKWARNLKGSTGQIRNSVERMTEAPGKKAAAAKDTWVARMTDPSTHEKWARRVAGVSLSEWQERFVTKGIPNLSTGVDAASSKMEEYLSALFAYQDANVQKVRAIPKLTNEDSKRRMLEWFDIMSKFRYK